jgi:hypothetical protein
MSERNLRKRLSALDDPDLNRREFIGKMIGYASIVTLSTGTIVDTLVKQNSFREKVRKAKEKYPQLPQDVRDGSAEYKLQKHFTGEPQSDELNKLTQGEPTPPRDIFNRLFQIDSPDHQARIEENHRQVQEWVKQRDEAISDSYGDGPNPWPIAPGILGIIGGIGLAVTIDLRTGGEIDSGDKTERLKQALIAVNPQWIDNEPTDEEIEDFVRICRYYPPIGGKTGDSYSDKSITTSEPQYLAEVHAKKAIRYKNNHLARNIMVHQMTVQGRLGDRFKHAALVLILNNPYPVDWNKPAFNAYWAQVAPLVHDGGRVDRQLNRSWKYVKGRTDMISQTAVKFNASTPDSVGSAANEAEDKRILQEAIFYQRAALAFHAFSRTAPPDMPFPMRKELAREWLTFENRVSLLLQEYDLADVLSPKWFLKIPRYKSWPKPFRREAPYEPVKRKLNRLEEVHEEHLWELRERSSLMMGQLVAAVDHITGLDKYMKNAPKAA